MKSEKKAGRAAKLLVYGVTLASSVALSLAVTVPMAATVLVMRSILPKREPDTKCGP